ncbi:MAG TPA: hypothetical protein VLJ38_12620, partial [Polyangiaceae bacterium]|nr:hypothetical protein [Polyangiaceae bacterium]
MSGRLSRRELMRGGAGLAGLTLSEPTPALAAASYAPETVVLVQLAGGADGASLLVPYTEERYYQARPTLALPPPGRSTHATLALDDRHALHPALRALEGLYHAGELGFVVGVGMPALVRSHCDARRSLAASVTGLLGGRAPLRMHGA